MLKSVRLKNFKLHEDTSIEAALITVFIGPNNSGKSSVFQALLALKQAVFYATNQFIRPPSNQPSPDEIVDLGEFKDIARESESQVYLGSTGKIHSTKPSLRDLPVDICFEIYVRENFIAAHEGSVESRYGRFDWRRAVGSPQAAEQHRVQYGEAELIFAEINTFQLIGPSSYTLPGGAAPEKVAEIQEVLNYLGNAPGLLMRSVHPIYPLRGFEQSGYPLPAGETGQLEGPTFGRRTDALVSRLAYNNRLREQVSERLEGLLRLRIEYELVPGHRVTIQATRVTDGKAKTLIANEGTGANQLPFILVPIALTPPNETILLSEPEAHLHPKGQSQLTGMLIEIAKKENLQFFIETHSEHVLHKLLNAVAKGELATDDLAIYYFENENGTARVQRLAVNDKGQVDGGLRGFYDQSLTELSEYLDALRKP